MRVACVRVALVRVCICEGVHVSKSEWPGRTWGEQREEGGRGREVGGGGMGEGARRREVQVTSV